MRLMNRVSMCTLLAWGAVLLADVAHAQQVQPGDLGVVQAPAAGSIPVPLNQVPLPIRHSARSRSSCMRAARPWSQRRSTLRVDDEKIDEANSTEEFPDPSEGVGNPQNAVRGGRHVVGADQFAQSRCVEIRNACQIQQDSSLPTAEERLDPMPQISVDRRGNIQLEPIRARHCI
jgi:hypothetical protein